MSWTEIVKQRLPVRGKVWLRSRFDNTLATRKDLYYCFRLLLQREPDPEGWKTYWASIRTGSMSVERLVRSFLQSPECKEKLREESEDEQPVKADLASFSVLVAPRDGAVGRAILQDGCYEPHVSARMDEILQPGMTVIDVGANLGYMSLLAASKVGENGRVLAFEPGVRNCELMHRSARLNHFDQIEIFPFAASNQEKTVSYLEIDGNGTIRDIAEGLAGVMVRTVKLDSLLCDLDRLDLLKLDVEGAEYLVLQGAEKLIDKHRPVMLVEFQPTALRQVSGVEPVSFLEWFIQHGYTFEVIVEDGRKKSYNQDASRLAEDCLRTAKGYVDLELRP